MTVVPELSGDQVQGGERTVADFGTDPATESVRRSARRGLTLYFALVLVLSGGLEAYMIANPGSFGTLVLPLMWTPALASVVARVVLREGFGDVSFRFGGRRTLRWYALGLAIPLVVGFVAYGAGWLTGLVQFSGSARDLLVALGIAATYTTVINLVFATGEEIGWRGYMLTRLIDAGVPRPVLVSGLIWAAWHLPLVFAGAYAAGPNPALSAVLFVVAVTSITFVYSRIRLETGSIWPVIYAHAAWNSIVQGPFDGATQGANAGLWTGESGILTVAVLVILTVVLSRGRWTYLRRPADVRRSASGTAESVPARPSTPEPR